MLGTKLPDKTVMSARADIAPKKTVSLGCLIAIIAAIKKVLSPNSETTITDKDATKAWMNPRLLTPLFGVTLSIL